MCQDSRTITDPLSLGAGYICRIYCILMFGIIGTYLNISGIVPDRELWDFLQAAIRVALGVIDDIKQRS